MMQGASGTFRVLPGRWDLLISILHYLHCVFTFLCRSKALCLIQNSLRTSICHAVFLFLCSHLRFPFGLGPRYSVPSFYYVSLVFGLFQLHLFLSFFLSLLHAATPSFNFHFSSSTPKYFLSLHLCKTSL